MSFLKSTAAARPRLRLRLLSAFTMVFALAIRAQAVGATPAEELAKARAAFRAGDYATAVPLLNYLLYPTARLSDSAELAEAHLLLAVAYYDTHDQSRAEREFEAALLLDGGLTIDSPPFSAGAVDFFAKIRQRHLRKQDEESAARRIAEERDAYRRALENLYVVEKRKYYVNFIPFGAGQFQNGERDKGIAFFVAEALLGGTSLGMFAIQVTRYGFTGPVPVDDLRFVNRLQLVQLSSGGLCLVVIAWGIIDSLTHYQPTIERTPDESLLPEDWRRRQQKNNDTGSFRLRPIVTPRGLGLGLSWWF